MTWGCPPGQEHLQPQPLPASRIGALGWGLRSQGTRPPAFAEGLLVPRAQNGLLLPGPPRIPVGPEPRRSPKPTAAVPAQRLPNIPPGGPAPRSYRLLETPGGAHLVRRRLLGGCAELVRSRFGGCGAGAVGLAGGAGRPPPYKAEECAPSGAGPGQPLRPYLASTLEGGGALALLTPPSCRQGLPLLGDGEVMGEGPLLPAA